MSDPIIPHPLDPDHVLERYRHALGEFLHDFAWLEVCLFNLLCAAADIDEGIGRALFSGTRSDQLCQFIRRCFIARNLTMEPYLDRALSHVAVLNKARNEAVHFTTFEIEDEGEAVLATNQFRYMPDGVINRLLTPEVLYAMSKDARIVPAMISVAEAELREPESTGELLAEMRNVQPAWRYKPPSQAHRQR